MPVRGNIKLMHVFFDPSYKNTLYFEDIDTQYAYFQNKPGQTLVEQSYSRVDEKTVRVQLTTSQCYQYNYIMIENAEGLAQRKRSVYGFIKEQRYINERTTELIYEIDPVQTLLPQAGLSDCFIERNHTQTDELYEHTVAEEIATGPYVNESTQNSYVIGDFAILVAATWKYTITEQAGVKKVTFSNATDAQLRCGLPTVVVYHIFYLTNDGLELFDTLMTAVQEQDKLDGVVGVFWVPANILSADKNTGHIGTFKLPANVQNFSRFHWTDTGNPIRTKTYTPRNNKLFSYPYSFLMVSNNQGQTAEYRYELFSADAARNGPQAQIYGGLNCTPSLIMVPQNYENTLQDFDNRLEINNFPMLSYVTDSFKAWLAQNESSNILKALTGIIGVAIGGAAGSASTMFSGAVQTTSVFADILQNSRKAPQVSNSSGNSALAAVDQITFTATVRHITPEYAQIIDDFFSMYGYAINEIHAPKTCMKKRQHWTYLKTKGVQVLSDYLFNVGADVSRRLEAILDNGITFWLQEAEIGNYSLVNGVLTTSQTNESGDESE